jgi:hypothetical protein
MSLGIGGGGQLGIAHEVTPGTFVAAAKFTPINSESLTQNEATVFRRPIRRSVGIVGAVAGNEHVSGDIEMEALEDVVTYFLYAARTSVVKSGATNFTYTFTPSATAIPARTLSITIERVTGQVFAYVGCVVGSFRFTINEGMLMFNVSIVGRSEASQSAPTPTFTTTTPFGAGMYSIEFPTATAVTDTDTFEFAVEDNAEPQFRLKSTGRGADFIKYGERNATLTAERDFLTRADYDAFKSITAQSVTLSATKGVNNSITILLPVAIKDTYEVGLSSQGDLVRARISYQTIIDGSGNEYTITVKTQQDIT